MMERRDPPYPIVGWDFAVTDQGSLAITIRYLVCADRPETRQQLDSSIESLQVLADRKSTGSLARALAKEERKLAARQG